MGGVARVGAFGAIRRVIVLWKMCINISAFVAQASVCVYVIQQCGELQGSFLDKFDTYMSFYKDEDEENCNPYNYLSDCLRDIGTCNYCGICEDAIMGLEYVQVKRMNDMTAVLDSCVGTVLLLAKFALSVLIIVNLVGILSDIIVIFDTKKKFKIHTLGALIFNVVLSLIATYIARITFQKGKEVWKDFDITRCRMIDGVEFDCCTLNSRGVDLRDKFVNALDSMTFITYSLLEEVISSGISMWLLFVTVVPTLVVQGVTAAMKSRVADATQPPPQGAQEFIQNNRIE